MKVVFFATDNSASSGAFLCLYNLVSILKENYGLEATVILPKNGSGTELLKHGNIEYKIVRSTTWVTDDVPHSIVGKVKEWVFLCTRFIINEIAVLKCSKIIKGIEPDLIHVNTTFSSVGYRVGKRCRVPVIWHIREYLEESQKKKIWNRKHGYKTINKSNCIICVSHALANKYKNIFVQKKTRVIYDGVIEDNFLLMQSNHPEKITNLLCVGTLMKYKRQDIIIKAIKGLVDRGLTDIHLYIVGTGRCEDEYKELVKNLGVENYISFEGYSKNPEKYYQISQITLVPFVYEAFGRVTIEAMMAGSFVIGAKSGATEELLDKDNYGLLFETDDVDDLCDKLEFAISNPEVRNEVTERAKKRALSEFTAKRNAEIIFDLYNALMR